MDKRHQLKVGNLNYRMTAGWKINVMMNRQSFGLPGKDGFSLNSLFRALFAALVYWRLVRGKTFRFLSKAGIALWTGLILSCPEWLVKLSKSEFDPHGL